MITPDLAALPTSVRAWAERGTWVEHGGHRVFVLDTGEPDAPTPHPPLLVVHGFPSSSYDWQHVLAALSARRRVVLFDCIGFGLSDKPDFRYGIRLHADTAETVCELLRKIAIAKLATPITLVLDNAAYQRCQLVRDLAQQLGIELLFLPSYSPNLNLIERLWKFVKKQALHSRHHTNYADFHTAIETCLGIFATSRRTNDVG